MVVPNPNICRYGNCSVCARVRILSLLFILLFSAYVGGLYIILVILVLGICGIGAYGGRYWLFCCCLMLWDILYRDGGFRGLARAYLLGF